MRTSPHSFIHHQYILLPTEILVIHILTLIFCRKVLVQVPSHPGLNATRSLIVLDRPLTTDQLITYLFGAVAAAVGISGVITKVPDYFISRKQVNYLGMYMQQINKKYDEFNKVGNGVHSKQQYLDDLENIRDTITYLLQRRSISENQFKMLDDKISDYQEKINNTQVS